MGPSAATDGRVILFASVSDGENRARTVTVRSVSFDLAWRALADAAERAAARAGMRPQWLRVDWVESAENITWRTLGNRLRKTKRNYFRYGISLDPDFRHAFLETELNANAMLYGGPSVAHAVVNQKNFRRYARIRHGLADVSFAPGAPVTMFASRGVFVRAGEEVPHLLAGAGRGAGRRDIPRLAPADVAGLIAAGSAYLATQVHDDGRFTYGWHPCFDRELPGYNCLRHASTLYAMTEAWTVTRDATLMAAIRRALACLTGRFIRRRAAGGVPAAFLVEENGEIKLGGGAVAILAICKYCEVTGDHALLPLARELAEGVMMMQDAATGRFRHVLVWPDLAVKDAFRIIYYDGEATFALMRLHQLTGDPALLDAVRLAFRHFIAAGYENTHDHWLAYAAEALTRVCPEPEYYRLAVANVATYLDFVIGRITTYPTLLELMMATERVVRRLREDPQRAPLLEGLDVGRFYEALDMRAHYLLNGHFWPELSMFFASPGRITGSFFIRHHAFRVRIDDVEHYLSGLVAYHDWLRDMGAAGGSQAAA